MRKYVQLEVHKLITTLNDCVDTTCFARPPQPSLHEPNSKVVSYLGNNKNNKTTHSHIRTLRKAMRTMKLTPRQTGNNTHEILQIFAKPRDNPSPSATTTTTTTHITHQCLVENPNWYHQTSQSSSHYNYNHINCKKNRHNYHFTLNSKPKHILKQIFSNSSYCTLKCLKKTNGSIISNPREIFKEIFCTQ